MSSVWEHAKKQINSLTKEVKGVCSKCGDSIKCNRGSTSSLAKHLRSHGISIDVDKKSQSPKKVQVVGPSIRNFFRRRSLKEIVAGLATDGISIRAITRSSFIRESIIKDGYKLPLNESDVMALIHEEFVEKRMQMINAIKEKKENGQKFSISYDEYTSTANRRYIGINIHDGTITYKSGIVRIVGSCPADKMLSLIKGHLEIFNVFMDSDVVASTQDGAAVNKRMLGMINVVEQFCINHAIHLAVVDTLYKKKDCSNDVCISSTIIEEEDEDDDIENYDESSAFEKEYEILRDVNSNYFHVLQTARKIVKFIKNSPVRNDIFQSKVRDEFGRNIELHIDVQHRWNSIITMIDSLLKTKKCLFDTFIDLNALDMINELNFELLKSLRNALEPIKISVEALSRENATLFTAATVIEFLFDKLLLYNTNISRELYQNLKRRIDDRLNVDLMNLIKTLNEPTCVPSKQTLKFASELANRLFKPDDVIESTNDTVSDDAQSDIDPISLQDELKNLLSKENSHKWNENKKIEFKWINKEFQLFRHLQKRTENLEKLYSALMTIRPTSTDVERIFSICTNFCTKIRSRLSDKSLIALVFLKFYYNKV